MKQIFSALLAFPVLFAGCHRMATTAATTVVVADSAYTGEDYQYDTALPEEEDKLKETRLQFPHYTVVFNNFKGYYFDPEDPYSAHSFGDEKDPFAALKSPEQDMENYVETLIVLKDSMYLSEDLDERISNTLLQIIPDNPKDKFKVSMCYHSTLNEIIDSREFTSEQLEELYEKNLAIKETTPYTTIKDSAKFYFRALPHTSDMEAIKVVDGQIVPIRKRNTKKQVEDEEMLFNKEIARIKKKYSLTDTLVIIPGEYDTYATLTKDKRLYGYGYDSFVFRIERFQNKKLVETKYIVVGIMYGC